MNVFKKLQPFVILAIAGFISVYAFAPYNKPLFIVLSIFGLIWVTNQLKTKQMVLGVYVYGSCFFLSQLYWMFYSLYDVIQVGLINSSIGMLVFVVFLSTYILLSILLFRYLKTASSEFNYLFLLPSSWVIGEWLRGWLFTGFSWCDIGYTQVNNNLLQGFFPIIGSYGVSWVAMSVIGFLFYVLVNNKIMTMRQPVITNANRLAVVYFIATAIAGYYVHGVKYTTDYGRPVSFSLVQGNVNGAEKWDSNIFLTHLDMYASMISKSKADITLLPETAFPLYMEYLPPGYLDDIKNLAKMNNSELIIGMPKKIDNKNNYVNAAIVVSESGYPYYAKSHLVPFGEYIPFKDLWGSFYIFAGIPMTGFSSGGTHQQLLVVKNQKLAFNLCYENGFGSELIEATRDATLMVNLSDMVWYGHTIAADQHLQLSQARAMENQRYFIQDTNSGMTVIIDPFGHIEASLTPFTQNILTSYVQGKIGETPYQKYGNYLIISFSLLIILMALVVKLYIRFKSVKDVN